jgi:hypothetical protein
MNGYPNEAPEPNGMCCVCGSPTHNDNYCSPECMHKHYVALGYKSKGKVNELRLNAMFDQSENDDIEGVALDIEMDRDRESRSNRQWANNQEYLLGKDFKRMRGE